MLNWTRTFCKLERNHRENHRNLPSEAMTIKLPVVVGMLLIPIANGWAEPRWEGKTIVLGHSLGGSVALKYGAERGFDESVAGLIVAEAPYWGTAEDWEREWALPEREKSQAHG